MTFDFLREIQFVFLGDRRRTAIQPSPILLKLTVKPRDLVRPVYGNGCQATRLGVITLSRQALQDNIWDRAFAGLDDQLLRSQVIGQRSNQTKYQHTLNNIHYDTSF